MADDFSRGDAPLTLEQLERSAPEPVVQAVAVADQVPARPVQWRELIAVGGMVLLTDVTVYNGHGFAGYGLLFVLAPLLLWLGSWARPDRRVWMIGGMLLLLAFKLVWCGSALLVLSGVVLVVAFSMALAGHIPYVIELAVYASQTVLSGYGGLIDYRNAAAGIKPRIPRFHWLNVAFPIGAVLAFGTLFVLANPDLLKTFGTGFEWFIDNVRAWVVAQLPGPLEVIFWAVVAWLTIGLLRPALRRTTGFAEVEEAIDGKQGPVEAPLYQAFRNTLATVIGLFAVYLVFEFATLWFREFPEGFYYSGYAHEGAAWLTVALALATVLLSLVFRGTMLRDPRLANLRKLSWIWSFENLLLAIAVYNRLLIYVGFNGMTRMRMIGFFGITLVVVGFVLVLVKIARNKGFVWLLRRHLWAFAIAIYIYALTPVDTIVVRHNVRRILSGDPAPCVQISVHPINSEGVPGLVPLLDCEDALIREGVRAILAEELGSAEVESTKQSANGWTTYQAAESRMLRKLRAVRNELATYADADQQAVARKRFDDYAYQWY